jgi:hypothetical protein
VDYKGYISAVFNSVPTKGKYAPSYLDTEIISRTDLTILRRLLLYEMESGPFSVYKIYSYFKRALANPKAYKNVHQWIQKLYSLGMIEEVYGNYARGARFYRISTGGWLKLILDATFMYIGYGEALIKYYDQNIFFKTFILPYFEIDTVRYHLKRSLGLDLYLIDCCEATIIFLEEVNREWLTKKLQSEEELKIWDIDLEVKAFLYKSIVEIAKKLSIDYYHPRVRKELIDTLSRDKKFMEAIKQARNDFDSSYERLLHELT